MTTRLRPLGLAGLFGLCLLWLGSAVAASLPDFSELVEGNSAAVVNISTKQAEKLKRAMPHGFKMPDVPDDSPFHDFLKRFFGDDLEMPDQFDSRSLGSGFIISGDGYVMTNHHVVAEADEIIVRLSDRREFVAKVIGSDKASDVALIKIDATDLPTVRIGKSSELKVGEWVLAIGSPFGFENSVTAGVVSAKGRSLPDDSFVPFIQTDVAVNPGNSGGPLFNTRGEVVGINSQIYTHTGGYQGLSFAIPIEVAAKVKDQIVATGHASHARLGVTVQEVNQTLAESFGLDRPEGALVASVVPDGPADKAGLKAGDVIRQYNGQPIVASSDLPALIGQAAPGDKVTLDVWRHGKRQDLQARLGDANDKSSDVAQNSQSAEHGRLGLALRPLQPQERREAGVSSGLLIEDVSGAAAMAGVQPGDVLLAVNGTTVKSVEQVRAVVAKSEKSVALLIQRDGDKIFVPVRLG